MTPHERTSLRAHLLATGLAGETRTTRENTVANAEKLAAGDPDKSLGVGPRGRDAAAVMEAVSALCGCSLSLSEREGGGVIDPDLVLDALAKMEARLVQAAQRNERMIIATGHPTGLLPMYQAIARALTKAGVKLETPLENVTLYRAARGRPRRVRYLDGVAVLNDGASLLHTHESEPMERLLEAIASPDLVLGDHGWAGAAAVRGIEVVCFTDVNDPALAVAKADGLIDVVVPLDDNLPPSNYDPLRDYLVGRITA
jgi:histidinol phosphate phosphatase hisN-like protein